MFKKTVSNRAPSWITLIATVSGCLSTVSAQNSWTGVTDNNWSVGSNWSSGVPGALDDVIFGTPVPGIAGSSIVLGAGSLANSLWVQDNYAFSGGDLSLSSGEIRVNLGQQLVLNSILSGSNGLTLLGGGVLRLTNILNDYTGDTNLAGGMLVITDPAQLGLSTSAINITAGNPVPQNNTTLGITGGGLMLDGSGGSIILARDLNLEGRGHFGDRSGALVSVGSNTLSGVINTSFSTQFPITNRPTRLLSSNGLLTISGTLNVGSNTAGAQVTTLGGLNSAGAGGSFAVTGTVAGQGYLEKAGAGVLFWTPDDTSNFLGRLRISGAATGGQSSVRVTSLLDGSSGTNIFGVANSADASAPIDLNGGVLEIRNENSLNYGKNVYLRAASTLFVGPGLGGEAINNTMTFGNFRLTANQTPTFNSRNGYGITFGAWTQEGSANPNTITNNMGGTLTFTGNAWNNSDGSARTLTIAGAGNTVITGGINTSGAGVKTLTKQGAGVLEIRGSGTTLNGPVNVQGGAVQITDFRSLNNNSENINLGSSNATVGLIVGTSAAPTAAGLTTNKVVNLIGSGGAAHIYANQSGSDPVIFNANFTSAATTNKTLVLGGTSTVNNIINGAIPNGTGSNLTLLQKIGTGTWTLAGANTFTGLTTVSNGTLRIQTNAPTSTVLSASNNVTFEQINGFAGATLEIVGQNSVNNLQTIGTLTPANGMNTVRLVPGTGGTVGLTITTLGTVAATSGVNFITTPGNTITLAGANGLVNRLLYFNGADFAFRDTNVLRAPVYGTDTNFATSATSLTAGQNNQITGSFTTPGAVSITTLKIDGSQTLTLGGNLTLTAGGLLATGGNAVITGFADLALAGQAFAVRVNQAADTLTIATNDLSGTAGLNKNGAGTLVLAGPSSATGQITINEGTLRLALAGNLGASNRNIVVRQLGTLDFNGITVGDLGAFTNNGVVTNSSSSPVTLTIGGNNNGGTSYGVINEPSGRIHVTKIGSNNMSWLGTSNYTGVTTIENNASNAVGTGLITVDTLTNIGQPSGIGRGDASNNAGSLVFSGLNAGLVFTGALRETNKALTLGFTSTSTDRLFTMAADTVNIVSSAANNNALIWSNTGALAHGSPAPRTLLLRGGSVGDNTFNPQITDSGVGPNVTSLTKSEAGQWNLGNSNNTHSGLTTVNNGILALNHNGALSPNSPLVMAPTSATSSAIFQMSGVFERDLTAAPTIGLGEFSFAGTIASTTGGAGFAAHTSPLTVALGGIATPTPLTWGVGGFVGTTVNQNLVLSSSTALSFVDFRNSIDLDSGSNALLSVDTTSGSAVVTTASTSSLRIGQPITGDGIPANAVIVSITDATTFVISANATATATGVSATVDPARRTINVLDNGNTGADYAILSGVISGANGVLRKIGAGTLVLSGDNTYTGVTAHEAGTLQIYSFGSSSGPATSNLGASGVAMTDANAITLGNGGTGASILQYSGPGEVTDRKIRINTTTGNTQIHADGTGPLVLQNLVNDMAAGAKTLFLRGNSVFTNFVESQLSDNGGALSITIDSSAAWVLTNPLNDFTGNINVNAGLFGIASNSALGTGTLVTTNGIIMPYGGDRVVSNNLTLANNASNGWQGDYNLTFTGTVNFAAAANNITTNNSIVEGKALTFNGMTANALTANRIWTLNGPGHTVINGDFTTTTTFGVATTINNGMLSLGGTGASNFNQNGANIDIDNGTLRFIASNALSSAVGAGGLIFSPEALPGDIARLEMNGTNQTVTSFTSTTNGTVIIDNNSASPSVLRIGAAGGTVNFGSGGGTYSILNSGAGALSVIHDGSTAGSFSSLVTLNHTGITGSEGGGVFTINSALNASTGLSVLNGSTLALLGGITNPALISSLTVSGGSTLSLLDGAANPLLNLNTLSLGTGSGTASLNLNVGDSATDTIALLAGGTLNLANTVTFNLTDAGLSANTTYTLLNIPDGGIAAFGLGNMIQGATPGGFDSMTWNVTDNLVQLTTGNLLSGNIYWRGLTDNTWNANANNWSNDKAGSIPALSIPGAAHNVIFAWDNVGTGPLATTLEQNFKINSLVFEAGVTTPSSVTVNPGAAPATRLEIAPALATDGISLAAGGPATVNIATPVRIGAPQTWTVNGATVLTVGELQGGANLTKSGTGRLVLGTPAAAAFNSTATMNVNVNAGTLEITNVEALGSVGNANLAAVSINPGAAFFYNGAASTVANALTLNGGALSAGTANQIYSGAINVAGSGSIVNLRDSNSATTSTAQRNIILTGVVSGSGSITLDSNDGVSGGNQLNGEFRIHNAASSWNGDLNVQRGTAIFANAGGVTPFFHYDGTINYNFRGRTVQQEFNGATITRTSPINFAASAIGEFQVTNVSGTLAAFVTLNQDGPVNLNAGSAARFFTSTAFSTINLNGGVVLNGNAAIGVGGGAVTSVVSINTTGISGTGNLAIHDNTALGAWGTTYRILAINTASSFAGNTTLGAGTLRLGHKDALSTGSLTITGAASLEAGTDLGGINAIPNAVIQNANLTAVGTQNLGIAGTYTATGANADRTLTNNLTAGSLQITGGVNLGAAANTAARTWTVTGPGTTEISGNIVNGNAFNNILTKAGTGTLILSGVNTYSGNTNVNAGFLGLGSNAALGTGTLVIGNGGGVFADGGDRVMANNVTMANNATNNWQGSFDLTFTGTSSLAAAANNVVTNNNIAAGKALTFNGLVANALTGVRTWTLNGTGHTIINGNFTTSTAHAVAVILNDGTLSLGGTGASNFNKNNTPVTVNNGMLRFIANNAVSSAAGSGGLVFSPLAANSQTARLELNGTSQTVNALTAVTDGAVIIDNNSASPATFRFGNNDSAINFGGGSGSYTIQNTGAGALSIIKTGNTTATFGSHLVLNHAGITASEGGGVFNIEAPLGATTGLSATDSSTLALIGGLTNPGLITSLEVGAGSTLSLLDGVGSSISNLMSLNLGGTGTGTATLNLNIGTGATDTLTLLAGGALTLGNTVTFNMTDAGLTANTTYTLLNLIDGGISAFGIGNMIQGATPGGFDSMTWNVTDNLVQITTGNLLVNTLYWRGLTDNTWNGNVDNWSDDKAGAVPATTIPGMGSSVIFAHDGAGPGPLVTTLEQNFKINTLTFEAGVTTPSSVTINPGALPSARLEVAPQFATDGVTVASGGPSFVNINTAFRIGNHQTWTVDDASSTLSIGSLQGGANVAKTGAGKVILTSDAAATLAPGVVFTLQQGELEMQSPVALGSSANSNLATIIANTGTVFFYNGPSDTVANPITLNGATLSAGTAAQTYSGVITVSADSTINLRDSNSPVLTTAPRNITLGAGLIGGGSLTLDSQDTGVAGNQINGTLTSNQDNSFWTGDLKILRGTFSTNHPNGLGAGSVIHFEKGRIQLGTGVGTPTINHDVTIASATGDAIGEFDLGNGVATNFAGQITLGGPGGSGELRVNMGNDAASSVISGGVVLAGKGLIGTRDAASRVLQINSIISETGGPQVLRLNDAAWGGTAGIIELPLANTYSGGTEINRGVIRLGDKLALGSGPVTIVGGSTIQALTDLSGANALLNDFALHGNPTLSGTNNITISGIFTANGADAARTLTSSLTGGATLVISGPVHLGATGNTAARTWTLGGAGTTEISGAIINNNAFANVLTKSGTGVLLLTNPDGNVAGTTGNTWTGGTNITGGTLRSGANHVLPNTGTITLNGGAGTHTLDLNGFNDTIAALTLGGGNGAAGSIHIVTTGAGTLTLGGAVTVTATGNWTNPALIQGNLSLGGANRTFNVGNSTGTDVDLRVEAVISSVGAFGITKEGLGTLLLTAANTYSGVTTINNGEFRVTGSINAAGNTTINNQALMLLDYTVLNDVADSKLNITSNMILAGGTLRLLGSSSVDNLQGINILNVNQGASDLIIENGGTQQMLLNANNIVKGVGGTLNLVLSSPNAIFQTSASNGPGGILGFITLDKSNFATIAAGIVQAHSSTVADDLATWTHLGNFTDTTGYTGSLNGLLTAASIRFNAANVPSTISLNSGAMLNVAGGILVTPNVGTGTATINGGYLRGSAGAGAELVIHQHNTAEDFEISSTIFGNTILTKSGNGTLILSGANSYTGVTYMNEGTLIIASDTRFGAASQINFKNSANIRFEVDDGVTAAIGGLVGGGGLGGLVQIGTGATLINAHNNNVTYSGTITGDGRLIKEGTGIMTLGTIAHNSFTGTVIVNQGQLTLGTNNISNLAQVSAFVLNAGSMLADFNGGTGAANKISDTAPLTLVNTGGLNGLMAQSNQQTTRNEVVGATTLLAGANTFTLNQNVAGPTADRFTTFTLASLARNNNATMLVRGPRLGDLTVGNSVDGFIASTRVIVTGGYESNLVGGGSTTVGTPNWSILPWGIGDTAINGAGNTFITYGANGFRVLDLTTEYEQLTDVGGITTANNVRFDGAADLLLDGANKTMNALLVQNTGGSPISLDGAGASLHVESGAFLIGGAQPVTLAGFSGVTTTSSGEYIFHITNTASNGVTLDVPLTTAGASLTKSSAGLLVLNATGSTYTGATTVNQGAIFIDGLDKLGDNGSGGLVLNNGEIVFGSAFDLSSIAVTLGVPATADILTTTGGRFNTNGFDIIFNNAIGGGGNGGLTKLGAGTLTLNAAANYTGHTSILGGTVVLGVNNAVSGGNLTVTNAALDIQGHSINVARFSTSGAAGVQINGNGTINASQGFGFAHNGPIVIDATLNSSNGGLDKSGPDSITFNKPVSVAGIVNHTGGTMTILDSITADLFTAGAGTIVTGIGTINSDVVLSGNAIIAPGSDTIEHGIEKLVISGSLSMGPDSRLHFLLGQTNFTAIEVDTIAYVDTLALFSVELAPGFTPSAGSSFKVLTWTNGPLTGDLDWSDNFFNLPSGVSWDLSQFSVDGTIRVAGASVPITITSQPQSTSVDINTPASFNVGVTGSEAWIIQWQKKDAFDVFQNIPGANALTFTIPSAAVADAGVYRVQVANENGTTVKLSDEVTLTVRTVPVIIAQPQNATVVSTFNHQFQVSVLGPEPYTFVWKKGTDPDDLSTFDPISGAPDSANYLITNVNKTLHQGFYLVEITNSFGTTVSDVAELKVNNRVTIATQPQNTTAPEGRFATFTVVAGGDAPPGGFTYQWRRNGINLVEGPNFVGVNTDTLQVRTLPDTLGNYSVVVGGFGPNAVSANATLAFGSHLIGFDVPPASQIVPLGSDFTLNVVTSGALPQSYRWLRGTRAASGANVFNTNTDTMVVLGATTANGGTYAVEVSNKVTSGADKKVSPPADIVVVDTGAKRFVIREGAASPRLSIATGGPATGFQWFETDGITSTPIAGATASTFTPPPLTAGRKLYFCRVNSSAGTLDGGINEVLIYNAPPVFNEVPNSAMPATTVGELYEYQVQMAEIAPGVPDPVRTAVSFSMSGAPRGLTINSAGLISGRALVPSGATPFTITITARNLAGPPVSVVKTLVVNDIDQGLIGAFTGPIDRHALNNNLGGVINVTTTRTGAFTVRVTMGTTTYTGRGPLSINTADPANPTTTITVRRGRLTPLVVTFKLKASDGTIDYAGTSITSAMVAGSAKFRGWINQWAKLRSKANPTPALAYSGLYTAGMSIDDGDAALIPQGTGYFSFNINARTGALRINGRLADGTPLTVSTIVGPQGQVLVFRTLYSASARGSVLGHFVIDQQVPGNLTDNTISDGPEGGLDWLRPFDPSPRARVYKNGFFEELSVVGSHYVYTNPTDMGINIATAAPNAVITMDKAGVNTSLPLLPGGNEVPVNVNGSNVVTVPGIPAINNPRNVSAKINAKTGLVTITFRLSENNPVPLAKPNPVVRNVTIQAMIIRDGVGDTKALGYFLLPQLPSMAQPNNALTAIQSGFGSLTKD